MFYVENFYNYVSENYVIYFNNNIFSFWEFLLF